MNDDGARSRQHPTVDTATRDDAPGLGGASRPPRVMLVDDDPGILEAIKEWLELRCGAEVSAFTSAEEAMVATRPGSFDVCVLDYQLSGANGLTLGAMLRQINPSARLILLSGELSATIESLALEHGFGRVFTKPVAPEVLLNAIVH